MDFSDNNLIKRFMKSVFTERILYNMIHSNHILKPTKPGHHLQSITLKRYEANLSICIVNVLEEYIERTKHLRNTETKLLISSQKPHKAVYN